MLIKNNVQEKKRMINASCSCGCGCGCNPKSAEKKGFKGVLRSCIRGASKEPELSPKT